MYTHAQVFVCQLLCFLFCCFCVCIMLLQEPVFKVSADQAPDASFSGKGSHKGESKGIVSILTMIIEDLVVSLFGWGLSSTLFISSALQRFLRLSCTSPIPSNIFGKIPGAK